MPRVTRDGLALSCVTLVGLIAFVSRSVFIGQDANWDLQNYHDYAAFAFLHGRYGLDVVAAVFQGDLNPLPYLPSYLLRHHLPARWAAGIMAAAQSIVVPLLVLGALCCLLASDGGSARTRGRWLVLAGLLAGSGTGILATGGPWAAFLWIRHDNPVFPAYNTLFSSRSAAVSDLADVRFLPHGVIDALTYPVRIAAGQHPTAEIPFAEPRFVVVLLLGLILLGLRVVRLSATGRSVAEPLPLVRLSIFATASFCVWLDMFAIERYEVAGEMVAGVLAVALLMRLLPRRLAGPAACLLTLLTIGLTGPADWWHRSWAAPFEVSLPEELRLPGAYLMVAHPNGYWAAALPDRSRLYSVLFDVTGVDVGCVLAAQRRYGLAHPPGGLVRTLGDDFPMAEAARTGLDAVGDVPAAPCLRMNSLRWVDTIVCRVEHAPGRSRAAATLPFETLIDYSIERLDLSRTGMGCEPAGWHDHGRTHGRADHRTRADRPPEPAGA